MSDFDDAYELGFDCGYEEGKDDGYEIGYNEGIENSISIYDAAELFTMFLDDTQPCDFNSMDEFVCDADWCEEHCGKCEPIDCWVNAIKEGWIRKAYDLASTREWTEGNPKD